MKLSIFQNYHLPEQFSILDPEFIPNNNIGKLNKFFENQVLLDIYNLRKDEWMRSDYVGLVSPRFKEKTTLIYQDILDKLLQDKKNNSLKDIYLLTPWDYLNKKSTISDKTFDEIKITCKEIDKDNLFSFKIYNYNSENCINFCNFWIAKPEKFIDYILNYLSPTMKWLDIKGKTDLKDILSREMPHRQKETGLHYPVHPFLLEGLFVIYTHYNKIPFDYILPKNYTQLKSMDTVLSERRLKKSQIMINRKEKHKKLKELESLKNSPDWFERLWYKCKVEYGIQQKKQEYKDLLELIKKHNLKTGIEIGAYSGGTTRGFLEVLNKLYTIDPYPRDKLNTLDQEFKNKFTLFPVDSHNKGTLDILKSKLKKDQIDKVDFLFIDGDHTYNGVKKDFLMYKNLVKKEGIIAFHDITGSERHHSEGCYVDKLWNEIKNEFKYYEIIHEDEEWGNIGILINN